MKITSYKQLDELVAKSLGWVECQLMVDNGEFTAESYETFYVPEYIFDEVESGEGEFDDELWVAENGLTPDFSLNWNDCQEILKECDKLDLLVTIYRNKDIIRCVIQPDEFDPNANTKFESIRDGLPRAEELAVCLSWLKFKGYELELDLPNID